VPVRTDKRERGITLLEMLVVVTLIALMAGLALPSFSGGMDALRLRSAAGSVAGALNFALRSAERRQLPVEVTISPSRSAVLVRSLASPQPKEFSFPPEVRVARVVPVDGGLAGTEQAAMSDRILILDPQGAPPALLIELRTAKGASRLVRVDPLTNAARVQMPDAEVANARR
jgi:prepilin-type N-terminal cleavage/methylation domain-containing protein